MKRMSCGPSKTAAVLFGFLATFGLWSATEAAAAPQIGIGYEVWFPRIPGGQDFWSPRWGTPLLGTYNSSDVKVIDQHAKWLSEMGVDFVLVDWSNNIANDLSGRPAVERTIIANTDALFAEYQRLSEAGQPHPKVAILMGAQNQNNVTCREAIESDAFKFEVDHIAGYVQKYPEIYFHLDGKPLLSIFLGVPACDELKWNDARFAVRWETGFLESQPNLYGGDPRQNRFWSWIDRDPVPAYRGGKVEAITVTQAFPGRTGWLGANHAGRGKSGTSKHSTFEAQWEKAVRYNPKLILINQWNEFAGNRPKTDQYNAEFSNDIEPTIELGCAPMRAVQKAIEKLKAEQLPKLDSKCGAQ